MSEDKKPILTTCWFMNIDTAQKFFQTCIDRQIADDDVEAKEAVLAELMKEDKHMMRADYDKPLDHVICHYKEKYGRIVEFRAKEDEDGSL